MKGKKTLSSTFLQTNPEISLLSYPLKR